MSSVNLCPEDFSRSGIQRFESFLRSSSASLGTNLGSRFARGGRIVCEAQDTTAAAVEVPNISDSEWQTQVLESDVPVLVEFWHRGVDLAGFRRQVQILQNQHRREPKHSQPLRDTQRPTVIIFKDGEKKDSIIGAVPKETLEKTIERFVVE
ncbi:hypothetical protein HID58_069181 [Brassica napus]|uniref:Thioredoxin domain-containing protein n=1 Tax=Brassica napus TaxID=3708 RepID=A0ABQ7XEX8_BRANA|nr:hypothetical protein HID58_069181 [Brassica napus]